MHASSAITWCMCYPLLTDILDESDAANAVVVTHVVTEAPDGSLADDAAAVALGLTNAPDVSLGGDANGVAANDAATNPKAHYQCPGTISMYLHVHLHVPPI